MPNVMAALPNTGGALCSTPQFGYAVTLPRRETRWNLLGCPKLTKWSQPLVGRRSPYCKDMWGRYCCLTSFFPIVDTCLSCEHIARQSCAMVRRWRFLWPPYVIGGPLYFCPVVSFLPSIFFYSSPNLSGRRLDVYNTSTHGVALVRI